jgi:hypothetical protein
VDVSIAAFEAGEYIAMAELCLGATPPSPEVRSAARRGCAAGGAVSAWRQEMATSL